MENIQTIRELADYLNRLSREALEEIDLSALPTWGEWRGDTSDVYSWDTTGERTLVLRSGDRWTIETLTA